MHSFSNGLHSSLTQFYIWHLEHTGVSLCCKHAQKLNCIGVSLLLHWHHQVCLNKHAHSIGLYCLVSLSFYLIHDMLTFLWTKFWIIVQVGELFSNCNIEIKDHKTHPTCSEAKIFWGHQNRTMGTPQSFKYKISTFWFHCCFYDHVIHDTHIFLHFYEWKLNERLGWQNFPQKSSHVQTVISYSSMAFLETVNSRVRVYMINVGGAKLEYRINWWPSSTDRSTMPSDTWILEYLRSHTVHIQCPCSSIKAVALRGVEWVHGLFLFPHVLEKM